MRVINIKKRMQTRFTRKVKVIYTSREFKGFFVNNPISELALAEVIESQIKRRRH